MTRWDKFSLSELREFERAFLTQKYKGTIKNKEVAKSLEKELEVSIKVRQDASG